MHQEPLTLTGNDISGQPNTTGVLNDIDSYALGPLSQALLVHLVLLLRMEAGLDLRNIVSLNYQALTKMLLRATKLERTVCWYKLDVTIFLSTPYRGVDPETNLSGCNE